MGAVVCQIKNLGSLLNAPISDRTRNSLIMALLVGLVVLLSKHLSLPETALSAYLIFFATRDNSVATIGIALALIAAVFLAVGLLILIIMAVAGQPALRIPVMFGITFFCMYLASGMANGAIAATIGMVLFEVLSGLDLLAYPGLELRGLFWVLTIVILPMVLIVIANVLVADSPSSLVKQRLNARVALIRAAMHQPNDAHAAEACRAYLMAGNGSLAPFRKLVKFGGSFSGSLRRLAWIEDRTALMMANCANGCPAEDSPKKIAFLTFPVQPVPSFESSEAEIDISRKPDVRMALVATLSVAICYFLFLVLQWPEIHTITITAFLVSQVTPGATIHKASLRIIGCLIGGIISLAALLWIVPFIENAAQLGFLCFVVAFPAAMIALRGELVAYIGMQIMLVFLLTVSNSSGPNVDFGVAWGRFVGILLGNVVVSVVFITLANDVAAARLRGVLAELRTKNRARSFGSSGDGLLMLQLLDALKDLKESIVVARFNPSFENTDCTSLDALSVDAELLAQEIICPIDERLLCAQDTSQPAFPK